jgi:hypothetical protein
MATCTRASPVSGAMDRPRCDRPPRRRERRRCRGPGTDARGVELRAEHAGALAVAGADLTATLDGQPLLTGVRMPHRRGQRRASSTRRRRGAARVSGIRGRPDRGPRFGSRATDLTSGLGGVSGRRLRAGDRVPVGSRRRTAGARRLRRCGRFPPAVPACGVARAARRVVSGGGARSVVPHALRGDVRVEPHGLSPARVRARCRARWANDLRRHLRRRPQVPPSGHPILLLADRK